MEQQLISFAALAVEAVTDNGAAEAKRMGGMYPKLMGPSGFREETKPGSCLMAAQLLPVGNAGFPFLRVVDLQGAVIGIEAEGQPDTALFFLYFPGNNRFIDFFYLPQFKLA